MNGFDSRKLLLGLLFAVLLAASVLWLRTQMRLDRCLDAGGGWHADGCVGARTTG